MLVCRGPNALVHSCSKSTQSQFSLIGLLILMWPKGDDMSDKAPVSDRYDKVYTSAPKSMQTVICMSRSTPPPARFDASVSNFCTITWKDGIEIASLPPFSNPSGKIFSKLSFDVVMTCTGGTVDVKIIHAGQKQATKNIGLEFQDYGGITN